SARLCFRRLVAPSGLTASFFRFFTAFRLFLSHHSGTMTLVELAEYEVAELGDAIAQLHALQTATHAHLLRFVYEYDRRQAWREDGCRTMADWLVSRLNIARRTA